MSFEQHCEECRQKLGTSYEEVHRWLDELFLTPEYGVHHRRARHHRAGIEEAGRLFGEGAERAALLHVVADLGLAAAELPRNEEDFLARGLD